MQKKEAVSLTLKRALVSVSLTRRRRKKGKNHKIFFGKEKLEKKPEFVALVL